MTEGAIQMRLRELADKVFGIDEGKMNPYRPHSLRSAFRSRLTGKTDGDLIKYWMGDVLGAKVGAYLNLPDEEPRKLYSAVEHRLSIESTSADEVKEKSVVQDIYLKRLTQVEQENDSLRKMVDSLGKSNERQERLLQMVVDRMVWLEGETTEEGEWVKDEDGNIRFKFAEGSE